LKKAFNSKKGGRYFSKNIIKEHKNIALKIVQFQLDLLLEGQEINQKELRLGFIVLTKQNQELVELNKQLTQQLETVVKESNKTRTGRKKTRK